MTLKEKIEDVNLNKGMSKNLEQIADDYAIEFVEWCVEKELFNAMRYDRITTKELLEIFKKEKGL